MVRMLTCHPERKHHAFGFCHQCYDKHHNQKYNKAGRRRVANKRDYNRNKKNRFRYKYHRRKTDIGYKLTCDLRTHLCGSIKKFDGKKLLSATKLIGCSIPELKKYLEAQFKPGMTWKNHKLRGWHIDHIKPCASFDLTKLEEQQKCFHYTNLQPLWWKENIIKGDRG